MALDGAAKTRASMSLHHVRESGGGAMEERLRLSVTIAQPQWAETKTCTRPGVQHQHV